MEFWRRNEIIRDKTIDFFFRIAASLSFTITILRNTRASKESKERGGVELLDHPRSCLRQDLKKRSGRTVSSWFVYYDTLADSKRCCRGGHRVEKSTAPFFLSRRKEWRDTSVSREIACRLKRSIISSRTIFFTSIDLFRFRKHPFPVQF